jgi:UDP-glucose 4-epimerase
VTSSRRPFGEREEVPAKEGEMLILVTGGAGRLGITVCKMLQKKGFQVRVFDLASERNRKSVKELGSKADVFWGDITDADSVWRAMQGVDAVIHMAGILPPVTEANPGLATKVNVGGTKTLVDAIRNRGLLIPFVFTSSVAVFGPTTAAVEPISVEKNAPDPKDVYGETKLKAETLIRESGVDCVILRLSAAMYTVFDLSDVRRVYDIPLDNRLELCHPEEVALAVVNAILNFETAKGNTLIISGGPKGRMLYKDMIGSILGVLRLPLPSARKFTHQPFYLDWYDTTKSQLLLQYQHKTFGDYLGDYRGALSRRFTPAFLPFMCYFVGPVFGKLVMRLM